MLLTLAKHLLDSFKYRALSLLGGPDVSGMVCCRCWQPIRHGRDFTYSIRRDCCHVNDMKRFLATWREVSPECGFERRPGVAGEFAVWVYVPIHRHLCATIRRDVKDAVHERLREQGQIIASNKKKIDYGLVNSV